MSNNAFPAAVPLLAEYADIEKQLADPAVHGDQNLARKLGRRYAELGQVAKAYEAWRNAADDAEAAAEMAKEDAEFAAELPALQEAKANAAEVLRTVLLPRDPDDGRDVIIEITGGAGGEESSLFAGDLLRMYMRYADRKGWSTEIIEASETDLGGYKSVHLAVKTKQPGAPQDGVWAHLKYEGGVHRVQRVPTTETQGRIHTSTAGVIALPEPDDEEEIEIDPNDLKIDVFRSGGPGGQSVNTTDSAVRITHLPTGMVVSMQNEKSQLQNKEAGLRVLRARLKEAAKLAAESEASASRQSQVKNRDRSERIRTYNFPENRISDHRNNYKAYNLDQVLQGDLEPLVQSLIATDEAERLAAPTE